MMEPETTSIEQSFRSTLHHVLQRFWREMYTLLSIDFFAVKQTIKPEATANAETTEFMM